MILADVDLARRLNGFEARGLKAMGENVRPFVKPLGLGRGQVLFASNSAVGHAMTHATERVEASRKQWARERSPRPESASA